MNPHDLDIAIGIIIGASISGMVASALWIHVCRRAGAPVIVAGDDEPFRPVTDSDLRIVRVCESCRRYQGPHRTITAGQHLSVLPLLCPRCAKRAALAVAPKPAVA